MVWETGHRGIVGCRRARVLGWARGVCVKSVFPFRGRSKQARRPPSARPTSHSFVFVFSVHYLARRLLSTGEPGVVIAEWGRFRDGRFYPPLHAVRRRSAPGVASFFRRAAGHLAHPPRPRTRGGVLAAHAIDADADSAPRAQITLTLCKCVRRMPSRTSGAAPARCEDASVQRCGVGGETERKKKRAEKENKHLVSTMIPGHT